MPCLGQHALPIVNTGLHHIFEKFREVFIEYLGTAASRFISILSQLGRGKITRTSELWLTSKKH